MRRKIGPYVDSLSGKISDQENTCDGTHPQTEQRSRIPTLIVSPSALGLASKRATI